MGVLGDYRAQLLDPPWDPTTYSDKGKGRHPLAYYDTMSIEKIAALPVRDYAAGVRRVLAREAVAEDAV